MLNISVHMAHILNRIPKEIPRKRSKCVYPGWFVWQSVVSCLLTICLLMLAGCQFPDQTLFIQTQSSPSAQTEQYLVAEIPYAQQQPIQSDAKLTDILHSWWNQNDDLAANNTNQSVEMKAVWISYLELDNILKGKTQQQFITHISQMMEHIQQKQLNTIFVQVRSHGDAYYPSDVYPWSLYVTGTVGKAPEFDPLDILVQVAQKYDITVHAWVNLFRLMTDDQMESVSDQYRIKSWYQNKTYMAKASDGYWYLNPRNPEVQQLIADGVTEILEQYDVAGVQVDDYFYHRIKPAVFGDTAQQGKEGVSALIKLMYDTVKRQDPDILFGVSPAGNIKGSTPVSDTSELTDLTLWCNEDGYLDYVAPQIYWDDDDPNAPFTEILDRWIDFMNNSNKTLYIGLAAYKFAQNDTLQAQVKRIDKESTIEGFIMFRYDHLT